MANVSVPETGSTIPDWAAPAFRQVTGILAREDFPCIFARQANRRKSGWLCFVDSVETETGRDTVRGAILAYLAVLERTSRTRATIMPLLVIARPCRPALSLKEYREQAWGLFQYLHDHDPDPWPAGVPGDPDRDDWSFCFGGIQLFSNVSDPAHQIHTSRNLGDSLVFAMQPRRNFDRVGGDDHKGRQVRAEIRARAARYEGQPVAPHLGFYGTPGNREWLQMATQDGEADHDFPEVCPFKFRSKPARSKGSPIEVLEFWFSERCRPLWFRSQRRFDDEIRERFGAVVQAAVDGALDHWSATSDGALALTIVLDQFTRNMYRGSPRAFEADSRARQVAAAAIDRQHDLAVPIERRIFFYLPFEHSEALADQERSVELFSRWALDHDASRRAYADEQMFYVLRHREIIQRFGRFPHRNATLGRTSTASEIAFLQEPCSSF